MTTQELKQEFKATHYMIYKAECYGTSDLRELQGLAEELESRGVEITEEQEIYFN